MKCKNNKGNELRGVCVNGERSLVSYVVHAEDLW